MDINNICTYTQDALTTDTSSDPGSPRDFRLLPLCKWENLALWDLRQRWLVVT